MGGSRYERSGRRYRRARRLDRSPRGVAAVVGTLLALLVFFALFGIFLTEYVPLWMTDNEAQFTAGVDAAISQLKAGADAQSAFGGPTVLTTSFPISSQGVPLLAQPTEAVLILLPPSCPNGFAGPTSRSPPPGTPINTTTCVFEREAFTAGAGATGLNLPWNMTVADAVFEVQLPNRYFSQETFYLEGDGIVQTQYGAHSALVVPPPLTVSHTAANTTVGTTFLGLYGNATVVIGQGTEQVYSHLLSSTRVTSNGLFHSAAGQAIPFNFTFEIGTRNLCAWYTYLSSVVAQAGLPAAGYSLKWYKGPGTGWTSATPASSFCSDATGYTYDVTLKVLNIAYASAISSSVAVSMGVGVA